MRELHPVGLHRQATHLYFPTQWSLTHLVKPTEKGNLHACFLEAEWACGTFRSSGQGIMGKHPESLSPRSMRAPARFLSFPLCWAERRYESLQSSLRPQDKTSLEIKYKCLSRYSHLLIFHSSATVKSNPHSASFCTQKETLGNRERARRPG